MNKNGIILYAIFCSVIGCIIAKVSYEAGQRQARLECSNLLKDLCIDVLNKDNHQLREAKDKEEA